MASLASREKPPVASPFGEKPPSRRSRTSSKPPPVLVRKNLRPRTRSAQQKLASQPLTLPKRKRRSRRQESPVIDLTMEEDASESRVHEESPLRRCSARLAARRLSSKAPERTPTSTEIAAETAAPGKQEQSPKRHSLSAVPPLPPRAALPELNLSPIKPPKAEPQLSQLMPHDSPQKCALVLSSPSKRRKCVAFSDSLELDISLSPLKITDNTTPKRSILKPPSTNVDSSPLDPSNLAMWVKTQRSLLHLFSTTHSPSNPQFWQPGTIIQLEPRSVDLLQLVDGCIEVLKDEAFPRKFECYATLNLVCKTNDANTLTELFLSEPSSWVSHVEKVTGFRAKASLTYVKDLCAFVRRDIELAEPNLFVKSEHPKLSPTRNNPFESRTLNQALKLIGCFLAIPSLNTLIPVSDVTWFYIHSCDVIVKPTLSKSLASPYLSILKDCHFAPKRRKGIFESHPDPLLEKILFALLNMKSFVSSSLINEKFIALRNLIQNFPAILAKNFHHWFPGLVLNLCDLSFVLYSKVIGTGVTTLLEAARNFLDNDDICLYTRKFLEGPMSLDHKSWITENLISLNSTITDNSVFDYVVLSLKEMLDNGQTKHAMDIWVGLTLLTGQYESGFLQWKHLTDWLNVHKKCFNEGPLQSQIIATSSWKAIIYKLSCQELREKARELPAPSPGKERAEVPRNKLRLLIYMFTTHSSVKIKRELEDAFHNSFLSILFNLLNNPSKTSGVSLASFWCRVFEPVMHQFYFKKDISSPNMHHLGLGILNRLLRPSSPADEKAYSSIRCLSNESVSLGEINSVSPRWVHARFERILQMLSVMFQLEFLDFEAKLSGLMSFLNAIKMVTKKEVQISDATLDIIDNVPLCLEVLLKHPKIPYESLFKLIVNLNDTFGAANMVGGSSDWKSVYEVFFAQTIHDLSAQQLNAILSMVYGAVGERRSLRFLVSLSHVNRACQRPDLHQFIGDSLSNKKALKFTPQEQTMIGTIFQSLDQNFAPIAKKLIQHIVLLKPEEFEAQVNKLKVADWNIQIFKFFVILMQDAPLGHLTRATHVLLCQRFEDPESQVEVVRLLLENKLNQEIDLLQEELVRVLKAYDSDASLMTLWNTYLTERAGEEDLDLEKFDSLVTMAIDTQLQTALALVGIHKLKKAQKAWANVHDKVAVSVGVESNISCEGNLAESSQESNESLANDNTSDDIEFSSTQSSSSTENINDSRDKENSGVSDSGKEEPYNADISSPEKSTIESRGSDTDESLQKRGTKRIVDEYLEKQSKRLRPSTENQNSKSENAKNETRTGDEIEAERLKLNERGACEPEESGELLGHETEEALLGPETKEEMPDFETTKESLVSEIREEVPGTETKAGACDIKTTEEKPDASEAAPMKSTSTAVAAECTQNNTALVPVQSGPPTSTDAVSVPSSIQSPSSVTEISSVLTGVKDVELAQMSAKDRYVLETEMMEFMLRMRRAAEKRNQ